MGKKRRILVVDDMADGRYMLESMLKGVGHEVVTATDGIDAFEKLNEGVFDLIISDVLMPKMDGFELCRACSHVERFRKIPLVFYTANYIGKKDEAFALSLGAKAYLRKPMDPDELVAIVDGVIKESEGTGGQASGTSEEDVRHFLAEHNRRLVDKLAEKVGVLEAEVAERKRAEEELKKSEEKTRSIAETALDAIIMCGNGAEVLFWNPAAERLFGYSKKEALGVSLADLIIPERYLEELKKGFSHFSKIGEGPLVGKTVEMTARRKDGSEFPIMHSISSLRMGEGWGAVGIIHDITERKRAESASTELGRILDDSLNEIYIFDAATMKFLQANAGACRNLGYSIEELRGMTPLDIKPEITLESFQGLLDPLRSGKQNRINFETLHQRKDGSLYPVEVHVQSSTYESAPAYVAMILDITERKRAAERLLGETEVTKNLLRLSEATSNTADIDEFIESVVGIAREITGTKMVMSYLWDGATNTFRPGKGAGLASGMQTLFRTTPVGLDSKLLKDAMDTGRAFVDLEKAGSEHLKLQQDGLFDWIEDVRAISLLPLVGKREYLGLIVCICVEHPRGECECTSERKREQMQAIANQVSTALEEALHYKESIARAMELSQKVETIETMSEISGSILSTLDVHEVIEVTARMVSRLVPSDWVRVIEVDSSGEELKFIAGFEEGGVFESVVVPFASTSLTEVVDTRRPQYIADLRALDSPLEVERDLLKRGYLSVLRIPIAVKGRVAGVLGLMSRRTSAFGPDDLSTLEKLSNQVGVALENARLVTDLKEFSIGTVRALAETIDAKSPWTRGHSERVTGIALKIAAEMGFSEEDLRDFRIAGLLHDIGKIGTNESILDKPGKLTDEELSEIRKHSEKGAEILAPIKQLSRILPTIRGHHEFYDGTGYPDGLKGTDIPLQARILAVADTADAMGADRPYRKGLSQEKIVAELKRCSGTQFDPEVVEAFLKTLEKDG